jgi:hypothetical protein
MKLILILSVFALLFDFLFIIVSKFFIKTDKHIRILFLVLPIVTIFCQYSLFLSSLFIGTTGAYIEKNPNMVMPIFPCNVVMWCMLVIGICWNKKESRFIQILIDFCFYFGFFSTLVGMFANADLFNEPTLKNYDGVKSLISHGALFLNVLCLGFYKIVKVDLLPNYIHLVIAVVAVGLIGVCNNLLAYAIGGYDFAYEINSMYLIRPSYEGIWWLKYQYIVPVALVLYFGLFNLLDLIFYKKGNRWTKRGFHW